MVGIRFIIFSEFLFVFAYNGKKEITKAIRNYKVVLKVTPKDFPKHSRVCGQQPSKVACSLVSWSHVESCKVKRPQIAFHIHNRTNMTAVDGSGGTLAKPEYTGSVTPITCITEVFTEFEAVGLNFDSAFHTQCGLRVVHTS